MKTLEKIVFILFSIMIFSSSLTLPDSMLAIYEYLLWGGFAVVSTIFILINRFKSPPKYIFRLILFTLICIVNAMISKYVYSPLFVAIGWLFAVLPFLHFLCSYNYQFKHSEIIKFIDILIKTAVLMNCAVLFESFILGSATTYCGLVGSSIFWVQFLTSANTQVIILCLGLSRITGNRRYLRYIVILALVILLSLQLKTCASLIVILAGYNFIYGKGGTIPKVMVSSFVILILFICMMQIKPVANKINHYYYIHTQEVDGTARVKLYDAAFKIAVDHFPLGTGQGTYGSIPANMFDSRVYYDYNLINVWGLSETDSVNFKMDAHWSSILGENGVVGLIVYLTIFLYPYMCIRKYKDRYKDYYFIITMCYAILIMESMALNLVLRLSMIVIYSGISGLIVRRISEDNKQQ